MVRQLTSIREVMWNYNKGKIKKQSENPSSFLVSVLWEKAF